MVREEFRSEEGGKTTTRGENEDLITDYVPLLYSLILAPLKEMGKDGVNESVETLEAYNLTPEHLKDHLIQLQLDSTVREEEFKSLPTQVKTALTRVYNANRAITQQSKGRKKQLLADAPEAKIDSEGEDGDAEAEVETELPSLD